MTYDFIVVINVSERSPYSMTDQGADYVRPVQVVQLQLVPMGMIVLVVEQVLQNLFRAGATTERTMISG